MSLIIAILAGFLSIMVPGIFLSLALLRKTELSLFEIAVIGFILGMIVPPGAVWLESYLIPVSSAFSFSAGLYNANVIAITIIGIILCIWQGALSLDMLKSVRGASRRGATVKDISSDYKKRISDLRAVISGMNVNLSIVKQHEKEEETLKRQHDTELQMAGSIGPEERSKIIAAHEAQERRLYEQHEAEEKQLMNATVGKQEIKINWIWALLLGLMVLTFATRIINIGNAPTYFEFDPYFDMISTQLILTYGTQLHLSHDAWPSLANGTVQRLQPLVPYMEAYWYDLAGGGSGASPAASNTLSIGSAAALAGASQYTPPNTTLLSLVSSYYPPIVAALLVFVVFVMLYRLYGDWPAIIGAALAATMPTLLTTFIAGEQLLEPWGIFAMFFFTMAYLLAAKYPKEKRYAILAGIAFASNFLGAHYYTVTTGILAIYILGQGLFNVLKKIENRDFYIMNIIVIAIIAITYVFYGPYEATLSQHTSAVLGIPIVVAFPLLALLLIAVFEYLPQLLKKRDMIKSVNLTTYLELFAAMVIVLLLLILFTPLGAPVKSYIALSKQFTTPSSPLFMTVQEYAPTGVNYNFGSGGFGPIGASIFGVNIIVWTVLLIFFGFMAYDIFKKGSQTAIFLIALVVPLMVAGMSEVKYLPHLGVAYIVVIGVILGELLLLIKERKNNRRLLQFVYAATIVIVLFEAYPSIYGALSAYGQSCTSIGNAGNSIGYSLFCNTVPQYWIEAMAWASKNVGPLGPRMLAWWDYGDWINWFGNSNAVIRGDNSVASVDYATAAAFVLGPSDGFNSTALARQMTAEQAEYVIFDQQIVPKWGALDFLACIDVNQTSYSYAISEGAQYGESYVLGTSNCETTHDPAEIIVPASPTINDYCASQNATSTALVGEIVLGYSLLNQTYCVPESFLESGNPTYLLSSNLTKTNIMLTTQLFQGETDIQGSEYYTFILLYLPNGPNDTITDAPSQFYNSNYYDGYFLGEMPGFTRVYPDNFSGINYVNSFVNLVIYKVDNYTGGLPPHTPKPSYITNNYTMPA